MESVEQQQQQRISQVIEASERAYTPYSNFKVGAILETSQGHTFAGCNVENASYGLTICAERTVVVKAVSEGAHSFTRIYVHAATEEFCWPCGACRQVLNEFGPNMDVISVNKHKDTLKSALQGLRDPSMDYQHREGGKTGSGGLLSEAEANVARRERLRKLALEAIDLTKDPYFMKNHLGSYECRLCLTLHNNEGSYLAHTQGKKHQANLGRRAAREAKQNGGSSILPTVVPKVEAPRPVVMKIGRPGYKVIKIRDPVTKYPGLLFQIHYPSPTAFTPKFRFMSAFEQKIEAPNKDFQYLVVAAEPYESVAFKIPNKGIDNSDERHFSYWDPDSRIFIVQVVFRSE